MTNPLELHGPEFLALYLMLLCAAIAIALAVRWALRVPGDEPGLHDPTLDPYETAYLAGGAQRASDTAIAGLMQRGVLGVNAAERKFTIEGDLPARSHPIEKAIAVPFASEPERSVADVRESAAPVVAEIHERLVEHGLIMDARPALRAQLLSPTPLLALLILGFMKIGVGLERGRPVGILVVLCVITGVIGVILMAKSPHRSRRGDLVLDRLQRENAALQYASSTRSTDLSGSDLALALALFGTGVLVGGPLTDLRTVLMPPASASGGSCGGSSCGGGCGGGCGS